MFTLDRVVPWGRSFDEYCRMFALSAADLDGRIVGCADGPASFNAEATARGLRVVSCDPLYRFSTADVRARIDGTAAEILETTRRNRGEFVWDMIPSVEALERLRRGAMDTFLRDFETGRDEGRYVDASLPSLPFADGAFDLALCSHFLFLYSATFDAAFHVAAVVEMCRVAGEARIFPLLALGAVPSPHVGPVSDALGARGFSVAVERVPYEFQRGGHSMMRVKGPGAA